MNSNKPAGVLRGLDCKTRAALVGRIGKRDQAITIRNDGQVSRVVCTGKQPRRGIARRQIWQVFTDGEPVQFGGVRGPGIDTSATAGNNNRALRQSAYIIKNGVPVLVRTGAHNTNTHNGAPLRFGKCIILLIKKHKPQTIRQKAAK